MINYAKLCKSSRTHQALLQSDVVSLLEGDHTVSHSILDESATLTPKESETIVYKSISKPNPDPPLFNLSQAHVLDKLLGNL